MFDTFAATLGMVPFAPVPVRLRLNPDGALGRRILAREDEIWIEWHNLAFAAEVEQEREERNPFLDDAFDAPGMTVGAYFGR
jgi:hypothetical protein